MCYIKLKKIWAVVLAALLLALAMPGAAQARIAGVPVYLEGVRLAALAVEQDGGTAGGSAHLSHPFGYGQFAAAGARRNDEYYLDGFPAGLSVAGMRGNIECGKSLTA